MKKKDLVFPIVIIIVGILCFIGSQFFNEPKKDPSTKPTEPETPVVSNTDNFNSKLIIAAFNEAHDSNYLISPYSIEIGLDLLREGTNGTTKAELDNVVPHRTIKDLNSANVKVSNAAFIKEDYKDYFEKTFTNKLQNDYHADILYDKFTKPDKINNWVKEKTNGMINKLLDNMSPDFVYGVANAVALDMKWVSEFECTNTRSAEFTKTDGTKINAQMMVQGYHANAKYLINDDYKAVSLPYKSEGDTNYEFVAILPNDLNSFIKGLDDNKIKDIMKGYKEPNSNTELVLHLPRFTYEFKLEDKSFVDVLANIGIKEIFNPDKADFTNAISSENLKKMDATNLYVNKAIHKTYIELSETGTKAAAVTYFGMDKNSAVMRQQIVEVKFDKPFVYMIRETGTNEILFFGVVNAPNEWEGTTCK